jgi:hypothetical protein
VGVVRGCGAARTGGARVVVLFSFCAVVSAGCGVVRTEGARWDVRAGARPNPICIESDSVWSPDMSCFNWNAGHESRLHMRYVERDPICILIGLRIHYR